MGVSILKKAGRCSRCGNMMEAGSEVSWKKLEFPVRHGGNGTIMRYNSRWAPMHTSHRECELAGVEGARNIDEALNILVQDAKKKVEILKRQKALFAGDEEMEPFIQKQVDQAEIDLKNLINEKG